MIRLFLDEDVPEAVAVGPLLAQQLPIGLIVTAMLKFLSSSKAKDVRNQLVWLSDWFK